MLTWSCSCFLVGILATVFMRCDGARRPTKVIYDSVTPHTSLTGASVQRGGGYYQQLYIDDTPRLIVGETNYVRMYSISDVSSEQDSFQLPLIPKPALIGLPCESERQEPEIDCQNYINVIYRAVANSKWYYCGTNGNYPQCWVCASAKCTDSEIINEVDAKHYVRDVFQYNQPFYIDSDSQVFGTGAEIGLARGIVSGVDGTFGSFEITTKSSNLNLINLGSDVDYLGDLIEFMNSDGDTHIYFFYREEATEYVSGSSAFYSRVGRVCKDDAGGNAGSTLVGAFTTFLKARLNCSVTGGDFPYNYDYLRDIYRSPRNPKILYAAFTDNTAGQVNSAVCVYNLDEIAAVFKESNVKGQTSISSLWLPYGETALDPRPGTCAVAFDESVYPVLRAYALTDQSIPNVQAYNPGTAGAYDRDSDPPVMVLDGLYVTQLVVHEDAVNSNDIFFLGTADGKVYKAYVEGSGLSAQTRLIEAIDLSDSSTAAACADGNYLDCDESVLSMIIHSDTDTDTNTVFVGTQSSLHELPVQHCADYTTYKDCIIVQDLYCIWTGGVSDGSCVTGSAASGDQCLDPDPHSCDPTKFPMPSPFEPTGCDLSGEPTYVRGLINGVNENMVQVNMWAQAAQGSVWGETTYSCSCGCQPMEITETTAQSTHDSMEYLLGSYLFDMSSCTTDADVTITLKANGNTMAKTVSVQMDSSAVETDQVKIELVRQVDAQMHAYYYQACWWQKSMEIQRNAEDVYCYNCNT